MALNHMLLTLPPERPNGLIEALGRLHCIHIICKNLWITFTILNYFYTCGFFSLALQPPWVLASAYMQLTSKTFISNMNEYCIIVKKNMKFMHIIALYWRLYCSLSLSPTEFDSVLRSLFTLTYPCNSRYTRMSRINEYKSKQGMQNCVESLYVIYRNIFFLIYSSDITN
jgi:hypothetical protein